MRHIKVQAALVLLIVFAFLTASCGFPDEPADISSSSETIKETVNTIEYKSIDEKDYFVAVGHFEDRIRLMHITGKWPEYVWWIHDPDKYSTGDIFVLKEELKARYEGLKQIKGPWEKDVYGSYVELDKIGNCKDIMTIKTLEVTAFDDDEIECCIYLKDPESAPEGESYEYIYRFATFGVFDANLHAKPGDIYIFAFPNKDIMIPLEKVEK